MAGCTDGLSDRSSKISPLKSVASAVVIVTDPFGELDLCAEYGLSGNSAMYSIAIKEVLSGEATGFLLGMAGLLGA